LLRGCYSGIGNAPRWRTLTRSAAILRALRYSLIAAYCWLRAQEITDELIELLIQKELGLHR
jgi:hypothetical protein